VLKPLTALKASPTNTAPNSKKRSRAVSVALMKAHAANSTARISVLSIVLLRSTQTLCFSSQYDVDPCGRDRRVALLAPRHDLHTSPGVGAGARHLPRHLPVCSQLYLHR
jgi:hypothetical protein